MANRSRPSQQKRHKERARQEKQKIKFERRQEAKANPRGPRQPGEDPDIAGIVPGPQPPREDMLIGDEIDIAVDADADVDEVNEV